MTPKRILFVCVENSFRSQIAEAFVRIHGGGAWEVYSAGSNPSGRIHPKAIETMRDIGYDLTKHASKSLGDIPELDYDAAVTMGCGDECPLIRAKRRESWDILDPKNMAPEDVAGVRDRIALKVKQLLATLNQS
jgi:arsenate reductase